MLCSSLCWMELRRKSGGEGGIRTPDTLSGMPVFKTGAINHSATSPTTTVLLQSTDLGPSSRVSIHLNSIAYKRAREPVQWFSRPVSTTHASLREDGTKSGTGVSLQQRPLPKLRETGDLFYFERPKAREWNCMIS